MAVQSGPGYCCNLNFDKDVAMKNVISTYPDISIPHSVFFGRTVHTTLAVTLIIPTPIAVKRPGRKRNRFPMSMPAMKATMLCLVYWGRPFPGGGTTSAERFEKVSIPPANFSVGIA
jgi:hypothetical protein